MSVHFHPVKIKSVKKEAPDCVSVTFEIPAELRDTFTFREGQNITIRKDFDGNYVRRSYSICTAPHEGELKVAIKKVPGGLFSSFANGGLKAGDELSLMPPTGKFNAKQSDTTAGNHLMIAAGSGITPVISIIKHLLKNEPGAAITLLYGNKSRASVIFFEELEGLKNRYIDRFTLINIFSRERTESPVSNGRIDAQKLSALKKLIRFYSFTDAYICGPSAMIFAAQQFLMEEGMEKSHIHFELFNAPGQAFSIPDTDQSATASTGPQSTVNIKLDGRNFEFKLGYSGQSILDAALQEGADLPFACKGGVCCTCRAKLVEGQVKMDVNYALEPEEVAQGFILTCQSHPRTDQVVIDFDVK